MQIHIKKEQNAMCKQMKMKLNLKQLNVFTKTQIPFANRELKMI
jgi:hypothetical protein